MFIRHKNNVLCCVKKNIKITKYTKKKYKSVENNKINFNINIYNVCIINRGITEEASSNVSCREVLAYCQPHIT